MSVELKIKTKSLTEESRIIRKEEHKLLKTVRWNLARHRESGSNDEYEIHSDTSFYKRQQLEKHRKVDVRNESRATHIARAFIAGVPYSVVENKVNDVDTFEKFILPRVVKMVMRYGNVEQGHQQPMGVQLSSDTATKFVKDKIVAWVSE